MRRDSGGRVRKEELMLIAEDLLLLLTDDHTGKLAVAANRVDLALAGAMLVDLALAGRVEVTDNGRLLVIDRSPMSDELLEKALAEVDRKHGKKPKDVLRALGDGLRASLYARLAGRGLVRHADTRLLGIFPSSAWPAAEVTHESTVRMDLEHALRVGVAEPRISALISLISALDAVTRIFDPWAVGMDGEELKANAEAIADGDWASEAVRKAVREMLAAIIAATATTMAAGSRS
jgi:hypothetical protein